MNTKVREVSRLHREAMRYADESTVARLLDDREEYLRCTRLAFEKEAEAAQLMVGEDIEPTRSVLHRSAATLAFRCEMYSEAKRLVHRALGGSPPSEIEYELNDLLGNIKLALSGFQLSERQLQLTLDGNEVAFGKALASAVTSRIPSVEELLRVVAKFTVPLYFDAVGAGSFYITLTIGKVNQPSLPGFDAYDEIIERLIQHLDLLNRGEHETLERTIADPKDYSDFVKAVLKIAPDGDAISSVNLQAMIAGRLQTIYFERNRDELSEIPIPDVPKARDAIQLTDTTVRKIGFLQRADGSEESVCELTTDTDGTWIIEVREDIIHEVLGNYWKRRVEVEGQRMKKTRSLKRILLENLANIREIPISPDQTSFVLS